jgi:signal transduction histidine kinase
VFGYDAVPSSLRFLETAGAGACTVAEPFSKEMNNVPHVWVHLSAETWYARILVANEHVLTPVVWQRLTMIRVALDAAFLRIAAEDQRVGYQRQLSDVRHDEQLKALRRFVLITSHKLNEPIMQLESIEEAFSGNGIFSEEDRQSVTPVLGRGVAKLKRVSMQLGKFRKNFGAPTKSTYRFLDRWVQRYFDSSARKLIDSVKHASLGHLVLADWGRMEEAFDQLTSNAREYFKPRNGVKDLCITIAARDIVGPKNSALKEGFPYVEILFSDNGPGIPENRRDGIFAEGTDDWTKTGTGMGLPLCRELMESMGGYIEFRKAEEFGATFALYLIQKRVS